MKRAAVLGIAAFYLLLTTGMFVCIVHCAAENLVKPGMQMTHNHSAKKHCDKTKGCDCCKKHGSYVIKENIKPSFEYQYSETAILIPYCSHAEILFSSPAIVKYCTGSNAPPGKSGKSIAIQLHALRI